jgi:hypothetical protein
MLKFGEWILIKEQMIGTASGQTAPQVSGVKKTPNNSGFDRTKKRIDSTLKGLFLKGNLKQTSRQVDNIINGEINNATTDLADAAKLASMRDSIKKNLAST